ncbi:MAG: C1 family peptidase [Nanoarchaeota archaeon]|nr:C1 family peptidase [Nanoarchaeota archaeon]
MIIKPLFFALITLLVFSKIAYSDIVLTKNDISSKSADSVDLRIMCKSGETWIYCEADAGVNDDYTLQKCDNGAYSQVWTRGSDFAYCCKGGILRGENVDELAELFVSSDNDCPTIPSYSACYCYNGDLRRGCKMSNQAEKGWVLSDTINCNNFVCSTQEQQVSLYYPENGVRCDSSIIEGRENDPALFYCKPSGDFSYLRTCPEDYQCVMGTCIPHIDDLGNPLVVVDDICSYPCEPGCTLPEKFFWSKDGWQTPVKNQGDCGSCWAFAAVGTVEAKFNIEQNMPDWDINLAEQELVSCVDGKSEGCKGGYPDEAFTYFSENGVLPEICFPYVDYFTFEQGPLRSIKGCNAECSTFDVKITSWQGNIKSSDESVKKNIVCNGPLTVISERWDHVVILDGYDDINGDWMIKNSWGSDYGYNGFERISYSDRYSDLTENTYFVGGVIKSNQ